jgi:predicted transglutaminase-like cysteine proteinase
MRAKASFYTLGCTVAVTLATIAAPAQARPSFAASAIIAPSAVYSAVSAACIGAQEANTAALAPLTQTKSGAILGGSVSQLDLMRMQQSAAAEPALSARTLAGSSAFSNTQPLQPAFGISRSALPFCQKQASDKNALAASRQMPDVTAARAPAIYSQDDFLASKRVTIGRTMFDSSWDRVRSESISHKRMERYLGKSAASGVKLLEQVNSWANQRIRYVEDKDLFGKADYWAGARTTLQLKLGDCEDIALVKMQLLAAAGVRREDMFLTIARDLARKADHAVLVVRTKEGYFLLDNSVDRVLEASESYDYRPVVSFNGKTSWLHGY